MSNTVWLIIALVVTLLAIGGYSLGLIARKRGLQERLRELGEQKGTRG